MATSRTLSWGSAEKLEIERRRRLGLELFDGGHEIGEFLGIVLREVALRRGFHVDALLSGSCRVEPPRAEERDVVGVLGGMEGVV